MTRFAFVLLAVLVAITTVGCPDKTTIPEAPPLVTPSQEARNAAGRIQNATSGARVRFSQRTGHIMSVSAHEPTVPLAPTQGTNDDDLGRTLIAYFQLHASEYGLTDPREELAEPVVESTDGSHLRFNGPSIPLPNSQDPALAQGRSLRLVQTHRGLRVLGRYAMGLFDHEGNLRAVIGRILPTPSLTNTTPTFSDAHARVLAQLDDAVASAESAAQGTSPLAWLRDHAEHAEHVEELVIAPENPLNPLSQPRLVYVVTFRYGLNKAIVHIDAHSSEIIWAFDATPTEWFDDGVFRLISAPNEASSTLTDVATTEMPDRSYMGWGFASGLVNRGQFVAISNSLRVPDRALTYFSTMSIERSGGNTWATDDNYTGLNRAASSLSSNLRKTMRWWNDRGWRSWDGAGSALWASVNNNKNADRSPNLNAWGGGGLLQFGDGTVRSTGLSFAADPEIVGHEYMHAVIDATSRLAYEYESGAVNESLADFFGAMQTAVGDRFANTQLGDTVGLPLRDFRDPAAFGQPDRYSAFVVTRGDAGGVHTNSGILNRAWDLLVSGGTMRGYTVAALGAARTEEMVRSANQVMRWDPFTNMEEYSATLVEWCDFRDALAALFSAPRITATCRAFETAFRAVELFPGSFDRDIELVQLTSDYSANYITARLSNIGTRDAINLTQYHIQIADPIGETSVVEIERSRIRPVAGSRYSDVDGGLLPGHTVEIVFTIPVDTAYASRNTLHYNISVIPRPDSRFTERDLTNNTGRYTIPVNLFGLYGEWMLDPTRDQMALVARFRSQSRFPVPNEVRNVFLTRTTAYGPLTHLTVSEAENMLESCESCRSGAYESRPILWFDLQHPPFESIVLAARSIAVPEDPNPREVWFNSRGGLDELEGRPQVYVLIDAEDAIVESNETDNLLCMNCNSAPERPTTYLGSTRVRLPSGVNIDSLFPAQFRTAARRLTSPAPLYYELGRRITPELPYRIPFSPPELDL